jgi:hypothetical protein
MTAWHMTSGTDQRVPADEAAERLLAVAAARGWSLTRAQLERRHRAGLIPRPRQIALGRGLGSVTVYPAGSAEQLIAGLEIGSRVRALPAVAWELWFAGRPVSMSDIRAYLEGLARLHDRIVLVIRAFGFGRRILPERVLRLLAQWARRRTTDQIQQAVRKRLHGAGQLETFLRISTELIGGVYQPPDLVHGPADDEGLLFEQGIGLASARKYAPIGANPWLSGDGHQALLAISTLFAGEWQKDLDALSDAQLREARGRCRALQEAVVMIGDEMGEIYGDEAFGLPAMADLLRQPDPLGTGMFVLAMARLRNEKFQRDLQQLLDMAAAWRKTVSPQLPGLRRLRGLPEVAALFSQQRLFAVLTDRAEQLRFEQDAKAAAIQHGPEIQEALAAAGIQMAQRDFPSARPIGDEGLTR